MRAVFALVLLIGFALAGGAVWLMQGYIGAQQAAVAEATELNRRTGPLTQVFAFNKPLKYGDPITRDDVQMIWLQANHLPEGVFRDEGSFFPADNPKPRYLMRASEANEVILASRVTAPGEPAGLTGKLGPGMRAFQIRLESTTGATTLIEQESLIDVYWTGAGSNGNGEITQLIESAMQVIAVDSGEQQFGMGSRTVTVSASSEQVARLAQAQATGRLTMALVASASDAVSGLIEVDRNRLLGVIKEEKVVEAAPEVCTIKTRKGAEVIEMPIPCTN